MTRIFLSPFFALLGSILLFGACSQNSHLTTDSSNRLDGLADLTVEKTADLPGGAVEGQIIVYTIAVINTGPVNATEVKIADACPAGTTSVSSPVASLGTYSSGVWDVGSLVLDAQETLILSCQINEGTGGTDISNEINLTDITARQRDPNIDNNQPSVTTVIKGAADLGVEKTTSTTDPLEEGEVYYYTVTVTNYGPSLATNVVLKDGCPQGATDAGAANYSVLQGTYDGVSWDAGNLSDGASSTLTFGCTVDVGSGGVTLRNTITSDDINADQVDPNNANNQVAVENTVKNEADISFTKTQSTPSTPIKEGDAVTYEVTVTNNGPAQATSIKLTDPCPTPTAYTNSFTASQGSYNGLDWLVGTLDSATVAGSNSSATLTFECLITSGMSGDSFENVLSPSSFSMDQIDIDPSNNNVSVNGTVENVADLSASKGVSPSGIPSEGDVLSYAIGLSNLGSAQATNVKLVDTCPLETTYQGAIPTQGTYDQPSGLWDVGIINNGASASMVLQCKINPATSDDPIENVILASQITMDQNDSNLSNNTSTVVSTVDNKSDLIINKKVAPVAPVDEGASVTYTIDVTNNGAAQATALSIADNCPSGMTDAGSGSYIPSAGTTFDGSTWTIGTLNHFATATLSFACIIDLGESGNNIKNEILSNDITMDQVDPNPSNNLPDVTTTVKNETDIEVLKTVDKQGPVVEGESLTYTITLNNLGPAQATQMQLSDGCPNGTTPTATSPVASMGSYASGIWSVPSLDPAPAPGVTLTFECTVDAGQGGGVVTNSIVPTDLTMDQIDLNTSNNAPSASSSVSEDSDLALTKAVSPTGNVPEGQDLTYTITATNNAGALITGLEITDPCPVDTTYVSHVPSGATGYNNLSGEWNIGNLALGATETLSLVCNVNPGTGGKIISNNITTGDVQMDQMNVGSDTPNVDNPVLNFADISLEKTVSPTIDVDEGESISFTLTLGNLGAAEATNLVISDACPTGTTLVSSTPTAGSYTAPNWTVGSLSVGAVESLVFSCSVDVGSSGLVLTNSVLAADMTMDQTDSDTTNNTPTAAVTVDNDADMIISKAVSPVGVAEEGDQLTYTLNATNDGPNQATNISIADSCPSGTVDAGLALYTPSPGTTYNGATWTIGTLNDGASASLSFDCIVLTGQGGIDVENVIVDSDLTLDQTDSNLINHEVTVLTPIKNEADLKVEKSVSPTGPVDEGSVLSYTLEIENLGAAQASTVMVADSCPTGTTPTGTPSMSQGSYDGTTWDLSSVLNINASGSTANNASLTFHCVVDAGQGGGTITNSIAAGDISLDQADINAGNNTPSVSNTVKNEADVDVTKAVVPTGTVNEGDTLTYTVTVQNNGLAQASGISVSDGCPTGTTPTGTPVAGQGTYTAGSWNVGMLNNTGTSTLEFDCLVAPGSAGTTITNTITATDFDMDQTDPDGFDPSSVSNLVDTQTDLHVVKALINPTPGTPNPVVGETVDVRYQIMMTNNGPAQATNIRVNDFCPTTTSFQGYISSVGGYSNFSGNWDLLSLNAGSSATLELVCQTNPGTNGSTITNTIDSVSMDQSDSNATPDTLTSEPFDVLSQSDIALTKSVVGLLNLPGSGVDGIAEINQQVSFQITASNTGPDLATNIKVVDQCPANMSYVGHSAGAGSYVSGSGEWTIPSLGVGITTQIALVCSVNPTNGGASTVGEVLTNTASLSSLDQTDTNTANNMADADVGVSCDGPISADFSKNDQFGFSQESVTGGCGSINVGQFTNNIYFENTCTGAGFDPNSKVRIEITDCGEVTDFVDTVIEFTTDGTPFESQAGSLISGDNAVLTAFTNNITTNYTDAQNISLEFDKLNFADQLVLNGHNFRGFNAITMCLNVEGQDRFSVSDGALDEANSRLGSKTVGLYDNHFMATTTTAPVPVTHPTYGPGFLPDVDMNYGNPLAVPPFEGVDNIIYTDGYLFGYVSENWFGSRNSGSKGGVPAGSSAATRWRIWTFDLGVFNGARNGNLRVVEYNQPNYGQTNWTGPKFSSTGATGNDYRFSFVDVIKDLFATQLSTSDTQICFNGTSDAGNTLIDNFNRLWSMGKIYGMPVDQRVTEVFVEFTDVNDQTTYPDGGNFLQFRISENPETRY